MKLTLALLCAPAITSALPGSDAGCDVCAVSRCAATAVALVSIWPRGALV